MLTSRLKNLRRSNSSKYLQTLLSRAACRQISAALTPACTGGCVKIFTPPTAACVPMDGLAPTVRWTLMSAPQTPASTGTAQMGWPPMSAAVSLVTLGTAVRRTSTTAVATSAWTGPLVLMALMDTPACVLPTSQGGSAGTVNEILSLLWRAFMPLMSLF